MTEVTRFGKDTKKQQKPGAQFTWFTSTKVPSLTPEVLRARLPQQVEAAPEGVRLPHAICLLYVCPHTAMYVSSYCHVCVLIMLYMCPHTAMCVSSYCCVCVLIMLYVCPHHAIYVPSYCYTTVLTLLYMCRLPRQGDWLGHNEVP